MMVSTLSITNAGAKCLTFLKMDKKVHLGEMDFLSIFYGFLLRGGPSWQDGLFCARWTSLSKCTQLLLQTCLLGNLVQATCVAHD